MKIWLIWFSYLLRGLLGRRRFIPLTPPNVRRQRLYDRVGKKWVRFTIRDHDDWIQVEHIFLNDEFDLTPTARTKEVERRYRELLAAGKTPLIVDLGANIGLASAYFHQAYPEARILSVEPDSGNCAIARQNLPAAATLIEAAVASHAGSGDLIDTGRNCGFQVVEADGGAVRFVTVADIIAQADTAEPFLIKIDIEGFEEDLFTGDTGWIDSFPILLIELHDWMLPGRQVTRNFLTEIARRQRDFMHFDGYAVSMASPL